VKRLVLVTSALVLLVAALGGASSHAITTATPPAGPTGIALDGRVDLAWQPVSGATGYTVYRGTMAASITTLLTASGGVAGTSFSDTTAANGTMYFYAVRAVAGGVESANSLTVQATPHPRTCATGNAVVLENCFPGDPGWNVTNPTQIGLGGIEGFATASSVNKGGSVDLKVNSDDNSTFRIEVYRSGYYAGAGARLFSVIRGVPGARQPGCIRDATTGLVDCSNWSTSATITTTSAWPSGVYLLRLVREDTGTDNQIMLTVRDDAGTSAILYGVAFTNYQAYNNYGGKSLYDFNSTGNVTVTGTPRAAKVSFDRPFEQPRSGLRDWYTRNEYATVYWLEREGFDVSYIANNDLESSPSLISGHKTYVDPAHSEYWSSGMRSALQQARDAGVNLFFTGGNELYWRIRFEASPTTGAANRTEVCYKTTQSGGADPSGIPTGTWRDPAGANQPENALTGQMYIGDNDFVNYPLVVSAAQGSDRIWRFTGLDAQAPGTSTPIGTDLLGWEWDGRVANGAEPAGVTTLAASPVTGELVQANGASYIQGQNATSTMVKYTAPSGALVVGTGTNNWYRGLAKNADGAGTPDIRIQQATTNILEDMGSAPQTPSAGITLDNPPSGRPAAPTGTSAVSIGTDSVAISWNAVAGATGYNVYRSLTPRQGGQPLGALASGVLITGTSLTDIGLNTATTYYYVVTAVSSGVQSLASPEASAQTAATAGQATRVNPGGGTYTALSGATFRADTFFTGGSIFQDGTRTISGTSDQPLYQNERWGQFSYSIPVANGTYDVRFHFVELFYGGAVHPGCAGKRVFSMDILDTQVSPDIANLDICAAVGPNTALIRTVPGVTVTDGALDIRSVYGSADDPEVAAIEVIPTASAPVAPTITDTAPLPGQTGVSRLAQPRVTFSKPMDATTITATSYKLATGGGTSVPATVSYDSATNTATLVPASSLAFSTSYTVTVASTVKSLDGLALAAPFSWTFTTADPVPPQVTSTFPVDGATSISPSVPPRATFSRSLDPSTVTSANFTLTGPSGPVLAVVSYDDSTRTMKLTPSGPLNFSTTYTARLGTGVTAVDGVALAAPVSWSFTTSAAPPPPPAVTTTSPADGATGVTLTSSVSATFSRDMDPATITATTFTLTGPAGAVNAAVSYDATSRTAQLTPTGNLSSSATYTARLDATIHATDGTPMSSAVTWSFTTVVPPPPPPAPTVTARTPGDGGTYVARSTTVTATFSRAMNAATITGTNFTLTGPSGPVPATVSYDSVANIATLTPGSSLAGGTTYAAHLGTAVTAADGAPLAAAVDWSFSTSACPCSLFSSVLQPASLNLPTKDGRTGAGPFSYETGVKLTVDEPMDITAIRFYKTSAETGTHTGSVWTTSGLLLASVGFSTETASGWQSQALPAPLVLQPGTVYVVSVNANNFFATTKSGLATQVVSGPIRTVADGANGVFGASAGTFPNQSFGSTNYFVDVQAIPDGDPAPPAVTVASPVGGATGVTRTATVTATFSRPLDPSSITTSSFTLTTSGGSAVPASVSYNDTTRTATLTPSTMLAYSSGYTAHLAASVRATDAKPLAGPVNWSFTTAAPAPFVVNSTIPAAGATGVVAFVTPSATFSRDADPTTITASTFTLTGPGGAVPASVAYDSPSQTATLTPLVSLTLGGTYTASIAASVAASDGISLGSAVTWTFTVTAAPPPPLNISSVSPADTATGVLRDTAVKVAFSRGATAATITSSTVHLLAPDGTVVPSTLTYDGPSATATIQPSSMLAASTAYTAEVTTGVTAAPDGTALSASKRWTFTTGGCPCSLLSTLTPTVTGNPTRDGRAGLGPWTYEFGMKFTVSQPESVRSIRFYKDARETGTHIGTIWSASGVKLATVTFSSETASGWQQQALATPLALTPGTVYVVSVNNNSFFDITRSGLTTAITAGPLASVAGPANGVFSGSAGTFPTQSFSSSNYFVDVAVG
jgi:hypothetical protein